jgi:hypothetical protein
MASNRCFDTFTPNTSASDYVNTTRQKTLFNDVNNNVNRFSTANPKKRNGSTYNNNFSVRETNNVSGIQGCLSSAKDYKLLLDITKGESIIANQNISCVPNTGDNKMDAPIFDSWSGNLYSVNYLENGVDTILGYDQANCVYYVDPLNYLFYDGCAFNVDFDNAYDANPLTDITGYPPEWFNVVDISFKNTNYYIEANRAQKLHGFNYPAKVVFGNINEINSCNDTNCSATSG